MKHSKLITAGLVVCLLTAVTSFGKSADKVFKRDRYLLLDSRVIESKENVHLTVGVAHKDKNNPLFKEDKPWEPRFDNPYSSVIYDEEEKIYKCWYSIFIKSGSRGDFPGEGLPSDKRAWVNWTEGRRGFGVCYATSKDGIHWEKPELGIIEFNGSKKNNIVIEYTHGVAVMKDLHETDPQKRYKAIHPELKNSAVWFSADGIRWGKKHNAGAISHGDTNQAIWWDENLGKYVLITRRWGGANTTGRYGRGGHRQKVRSVSSNFLKWSKPELVIEGLDLRMQVHDMLVIPHAGVYVGMVGLFDIEASKQWCELAWSPDSIKWHRIQPGTPLIPNGPVMGDYDWGCIFASKPIVRKDEILLYYGANDGRFMAWRNGFFCLARLRPDGFAGYEQIAGGSNKTGSLTTVPVSVVADSLCISADVAPSGYVKVTALDEDNNKLAEGELIAKTVTDAPIQWKDQFSLKNLKDKKIKLKFELRESKLFSFSFIGKAAVKKGSTKNLRDKDIKMKFEPRESKLYSFNFIEKAALKKDSTEKLKRVDLTKIVSPQVVAGNENNHYRDPTAIYHDGVFRLFFTVNQPRDNKKYMVSFLGTTTSRDLVNWTPVKLLTPEDPVLNYSSPGNIIRYKAEWIMCFQTYPIGSLKGFGGDQTARLFIMRSKDLENWSEPELLKVKGPDVPRERMGRMIDPYLIKDKDEPGKWWCFYKQNGVSMSYSYDLKTWKYFGRQKAGENSCVLVLKDHYYLIHSPGRDGMGLMSSMDLKNWEPVVEESIRLGYKVWPWAMARLTAGFALDLKEDPRVGKYLMFYHGTEHENPHEHIGNCSLGIAWSDDLINWSWPKKSERVEQAGNAIFDGKTLDGWHAVPKESASDWTVRDGVLVGHGSADRLSYLVWKDEHLTDFELKLRYRLPGKGNTGVEVRSRVDLTGKRPFEGYHADLGHVGIGPQVLGAWDFHFARRKEYPCNRGTRLVIDENGKPHSSTIRGALTVADIRSHQWNDVHIIARGNHFQFFINGKPASEFTDNAKSGRLDHGAIGLQIHDKDMQVEFKDIRLKQLGNQR